MSNPDRYSRAEGAELDLLAVLDTLMRNAWRIVFITAAVALTGAAWAYLWPPKYQADVLIQIEDSADGVAGSGLLGEVSSLFDVKSSAAAEAQIITSRMVVSRTAEKLRLYIEARPVRFPVIGDFVSRVADGRPLPGAFRIGGFAWGHESAEFTRLDVPKALYDEPFTLSVEAQGRYTLTSNYLDEPLHGTVGIERAVNTSYGQVVINVASINAQPGMRFKVVRHSFNDTVNELQQRLDVQEKVKQSGVIVATLLGRNAARTSRTLQEIGDQYVRQNVERKYADAGQSLAFLSAQLPDLRQKLEAAQERYTKLRNERGVIDLPAETATGLQQQAEAKTQLALLQQRRAELATRYTSMHPEIASVDQQIGLLRGRVTGFESELGRLPNVEQEAARLMLDVKVNTDLYTATLNNTQQLQLVKAGKVGSVRMIDTPVIQDDPAWPKRPLVIAGSIFGGLLLGLIYAFMRDFLRGASGSADEVERGSGLSVLASVPLSVAQKSITKHAASTPAGRVNLLANSAPHDQAVESFRSLRTALRMVLAGGQGKVVVLTGATPGVGKSFVAANFGAVLASVGQRVIVIDGDLRRPSLHPHFGVDRSPGLSDVLAGTISFELALHRIESPRLDFLAAGAVTHAPAELLLSSRTAGLIDSLRSAYDYVVIDTPPMLAVDDAAAFAAQSDAVLLVARAGQTRIGELRESGKRLERAGSKPVGVVLNGLSMRSARATYGSYGYTSYAYGSTEAERRPTLCSHLKSWVKQK